jgi:hypothetical protein
MTTICIAAVIVALALSMAAPTRSDASPQSIVRASQQAAVKARKAAMRRDALEDRREVVKSRLRKMEKLRGVLRRNGEDVSEVEESIQRLRRQDADLGD